ncbi:MAG: hypothetical protein GY797_07955 [Deltaproteobacteria bacterium]|nr:hypothetical protein [Deltaproteobacteria bacterium]MCP5007161.1 hypothetical protein [Planctomycetota bacterium]
MKKQKGKFGAAGDVKAASEKSGNKPKDVASNKEELIKEKTAKGKARRATSASKSKKGKEKKVEKTRNVRVKKVDGAKDYETIRKDDEIHPVCEAATDIDEISDDSQGYEEEDKQLKNEKTGERLLKVQFDENEKGRILAMGLYSEVENNTRALSPITEDKEAPATPKSLLVDEKANTGKKEHIFKESELSDELFNLRLIAIHKGYRVKTIKKNNGDEYDYKLVPIVK